MENGEPKVKHILKNVQGIVKPGQLCAIMGASGAGKTTLLNILNYRNRGKMITDGDIRINGQSAGLTEVTECSCSYVQQDDVFINTLTVKEHLTFLAMMKLSRNMTKDEKLERVEQIMLQMNLLHIQDTYIGEGDRLRGISGGEKRRLAFASEVLTDPQLLFCDEPTSGLDSFMAESIIDVMKLRGYISWFYYANEAINIELWSNVETVACNAAAGSCPNACRFKTVDDVLSLYSIRASNSSRNIGLLVYQEFLAI